MLFENELLKSKYEFNQELPDEMANISSLANEIVRITEIIKSMKDDQVIKFHHQDNNDKTIVVDVNLVSEDTWNRSSNAISEILYRNEKSDGTNQQQSSINKTLKKMGILKPDSLDEYKLYLQLLYFIYMINYFAFPNINIFKKLVTISYDVSYDEGTDNGNYISFMMSNIFDNQAVFDKFMKVTNISDKQMKYLTGESNYYVPLVNIKSNVLDLMIGYLHRYSMQAYCQDLINNLDISIFDFNQLEVPPFDIWKRRYVYLDELDDFLKGDELYWFCKQKIGKIESRDRIKFLNTKAINFLNNLIAYDYHWIATMNETKEGLLLEFDDNGFKIYALRIAVVIKTYNELTNKLKLKIKSGNSVKALRTILSVDNKYPPTIAIRLFMLACHYQYSNIIGKNDNLVKQETYNQEINFLKLMINVYNSNLYQTWLNNLAYFINK